jgi:hypothetical protein
MREKLRFLGLDVHAETIAVAVAEADGEVRSLGTIANREESIRKFIRKPGPPEHLRACYEAGPTGYYAWSPDSRTVYFSQTQTHAGMYRLSVPGGEWVRLSDIPDTTVYNEAFVSVTADGQPAIMSPAGAEQVYSLRWK